MESMDDQSNSSSTSMAIDAIDSNATNKDSSPEVIATSSTISSNVKPVGQPLVEFLNNLEDYTPTVRYIDSDSNVLLYLF